MMERRLHLCRRLLNPDESVLIVAIDENEVHRVALLLEQVFGGSKVQMAYEVQTGNALVVEVNVPPTRAFVCPDVSLCISVFPHCAHSTAPFLPHRRPHAPHPFSCTTNASFRRRYNRGFQEPKSWARLHPLRRLGSSRLRPRDGGRSARIFTAWGKVSLESFRYLTHMPPQSRGLLGMAFCFVDVVK